MSSSRPFRFERALLIVNPAARRAERERTKVESSFAAAGVRCDTLMTNAPGHGRELASRSGRDYDAVFTLGGDGTAVEVISALADSDVPIGILPGGTANVLVRSLGIPVRVADAVPALLGGAEQRIDLGALADGRCVAIGLGVGLDAAMVAGASPAMKRRLGSLAYVLSAVRAGLNERSFRVRLTVDGRTYERDAAAVLVANLGSVLHDRVCFGAGISPRDGLLHACVYSPRNLWDRVRILARLFGGGVERDVCTFMVCGRRIQLETQPRRVAQADGELLPPAPIDVCVRPLAARLLLPRA